MATDQGPAARQSGKAKPQTGAGGPPRITGLSSTAVCGFCAAGGLLVPSSRALRQLQKHPQEALYSLGQGRRLGRDFRAPGVRPAQRVPHNRHDHCPGPSAGGHGKRGSQNEALGRSRGGLSTKIYMLTDAFWAVHCAWSLPRVMRSTTALRRIFSCSKTLTPDT